jgi:hypothetical protein
MICKSCADSDQDRRPVSPPPCIQLLIVDERDGQEIDYRFVNDTMLVYLGDANNQPAK